MRPSGEGSERTAWHGSLPAQVPATGRISDNGDCGSAVCRDWEGAER